ncbi:NACHT domain-containing protein [Streptomyces cadmiisoli]|uniref:NACHT domain-containing protein n=1 Tax=Streptomyces cadmiisoli TaxID=2184053 RepID=UPI003D73FAF2
MSRYDLTRMGPHEFQRLTQALLLAEFGSHIQIHGMGPDGGRDASTYDDLLVSRASSPWTGYTVFQVKHKEELTRRTADAQWLLKETKAEIASWQKRAERPRQLLIITNVVLTPAPGGGEELLNSYISSLASSIGLNDWNIWHAEKICRLLDSHTAVRQKYLGLVMGDLLVTLSETLFAEQMELADTLADHLVKTFKAEKYAQLDQGGGVDDRKVPLARVFVDVPYHDAERGQEYLSPEEEAVSTGIASTAHIIRLANVAATPLDRQNDPSRGRFILIGGPGQGKSTLGRFLCQIYRAELLKRHEFLSLQPEVNAEIEHTRRLCAEEEIPLPTNLRFPVLISLPKFANALAGNPQTSLISFIAERIGDGFSAASVRRWLRRYPWLLILDGLDEVPVSANRDAMLEAVGSFNDAADACGADLVVIATSRPQGYKDDFASYYRISLSGLTRDQALRYSRRLTSIRHGEGSEKSLEIMGRVEKAANTAETARLMTTPLQVTILVLLLSRASQAPSQRYALFSNYYQVIYARELEKDTPSAKILDRYKNFVDLLHWRVGLRLQFEAAKAAHTEAFLTRDEVTFELQRMLGDEGYEEPDCSKLANDIMDSAADRLVFLVANTNERFGFELRSLQEFCAAQGLLEGGDEEIYERLAAISCSEYWRNVFQLASGSIFSSNTARRDMIFSICNELNAGDIAEFPGSSAACLGSQLAIDILGDRIADTAPRHQRLLTETAISIISVPVRNAWSMLPLMGVTDATSIKKIDSAIAQASISADVFERAGALANVASAAEYGDVDHLTELLSELSAETNEQRIKILQIALNTNPGRYALAWVLADQMPTFTPAQVSTLLGRINLSSWVGEEELGASLRPSVRFIAKLTRLVRDFRFRLDAQRYVEVRISPIRRLNDEQSDHLYSIAADAELAGPMGNWEFLRRAVLFANMPTPDTWSSAVDALLQADDEDVKAWWNRLPWPLAVWWETAKQALSVTEEDIANWQSAQEQWGEGNVMENIALQQPTLTPRVTGIPASLIRAPQSARLIVGPENIEEIAIELAAATRNRFWGARVNWWWNVVDRSKQGSAVVAGLPVHVCEALARSKTIIPTRIVLALSASGDLESINRADQIAKWAHGLSVSSVVTDDYNNLKDRVLQEWTTDLSRWGLARVLIRRPYFEIHKSWGEVRGLSNDDSGSFAKLLVAWGGHWREEDEQEIAQYLFEWATGQKKAPITCFEKFIGGTGGAKLAELCRENQDRRYVNVVSMLSHRHSSKVVSIPHPTFHVR